MIRCFVAIPLPDHIVERIAEVSDQLKRLGIDARFPRPESIHLTLKFLGDVEEFRVSVVLDALERAVSQFEAFEIVIRGTGTFPHLANPRVVWLGVELTVELRELQASVEEALTPLGFEIEKRRFSPHLTLARVKSRRMIANLMHFLEDRGQSIEVGSFLADKVILFRSELRSEGAVYRSLGSTALRSN